MNDTEIAELNEMFPRIMKKAKIHLVNGKGNRLILKRKSDGKLISFSKMKDFVNYINTMDLTDKPKAKRKTKRRIQKKGSLL